MIIHVKMSWWLNPMGNLNFSGIPSLTVDHSAGISACGTLFGVNSQSITLWAASKYCKLKT